jgi:hypothetical protein
MLTMNFFIFSVVVVSSCVASGSAWVSPARSNGRTTTSALQMGISSTVKRVRDSLTNKERSREDLKIGIAGFYDRSSKLWEEVWGEVRGLDNCCS